MGQQNINPPGEGSSGPGPMGQQNINVPGDGSSGMGAGMIVGLVLAVIVIGFILWYFLLNSGGSGTPTPSSFLLSHFLA